MTDFKTKRAAAKLPERTVPICMRGDLIAEFEELERQLQQPDTESDSKEGGTRVAVIARMDELRDEMAAATHIFRLRALPGPKYRELKAKFPPRKTDDGEIVPEDVILDANVDEFAEPLLRACLVDPEHVDDADWAETNDLLADSQYNQLVSTAFRVNRNGVDIPFSLAASRLRQSSESE